MMLERNSSPYFHQFDWDKLKTLYYVGKLGNISHAAQLLDTTQSSLSRHVSTLEQHLGYPLFTRAKGGVVLTHRGQELFDIAENVFVTIKGYTSRMNNGSKPSTRRKIRIATSRALASYLISSLIFEYNKMRPHLFFELLEMDNPIDVILHDVDIAIQPYTPKIKNQFWQVIQDPCFSVKMKLFASQRYLQRFGVPKSIEDLKHHSLIVPSSYQGYFSNDARKILEIARENKRSFPNLAFSSNSLECLIEAAQQDKGIISIYEKIHAINNSNLVSVLPEITIHQRQEYFVYPKFLKDDKDIINLKSYLKEKINQYTEGSSSPQNFDPLYQPLKTLSQ